MLISLLSSYLALHVLSLWAILVDVMFTYHIYKRRRRVYKLFPFTYFAVSLKCSLRFPHIQLMQDLLLRMDPDIYLFDKILCWFSHERLSIHLFICLLVALPICPLVCVWSLQTQSLMLLYRIFEVSKLQRLDLIMDMINSEKHWSRELINILTFNRNL